MQCFRQDCDKKHLCDKYMMASCLDRLEKEQKALMDEIRRSIGWVGCKYYDHYSKRHMGEININTAQIKINGAIYQLQEIRGNQLCL